MFRFKEDAIVAKNKGRIIIGNQDTGNWINISEKTYEKIKLDLSIQNKCQLLNKYSNLIKAGIIEQNVQKLNDTNVESLMIAITNKCNLQCLHCGFEAGPNEEKGIETDIIKKLIIENKFLKEITLTGGEPLLHPDFEELIDVLQNEFKGKKILMTNGTLINNYNIKKIGTVFNSISISIDGATRETCDKIRGNGVFDRVIETIKNLHEVGIEDISLSMTITDYNDQEEEKFIKLCENLDVEPIIRDLFLMGRAKKNKNLLESKIKNLTSNISEENFLEECKKIKLNGKCNAGKKSLYVQYDKSLYPCPVAATQSKFKMGTIDDEHIQLENIVKVIDDNAGYKEFTKISPEKISPCSECIVNKFCWGCLQEYYTYIQDKTNFSGFCTLQKTNLMKTIWREK